MKNLFACALLLLAACSAAPDAAPPAGMEGMEHQSPTGASGLDTGTSNVIYRGR